MRRLGPKSRSSTRTRSYWGSSKTGRRRSSCATTSSRGPSWKTMGCVRASCLMAAHPPADPRSRQHAAQALREELAGSLPSPAGVCSEHRWRRGHGRGEQARHHWPSGGLHGWALTACIAGRGSLQRNVEQQNVNLPRGRGDGWNEMISFGDRPLARRSSDPHENRSTLRPKAHHRLCCLQRASSSWPCPLLCDNVSTTAVYRLCASSSVQLA
jgi:hypothetical protein